MKLYRCVGKDELECLQNNRNYNKYISDTGDNTFDYNLSSYIHFFLSPECANYYKDLAEDFEYVITLEIDDNTIENCQIGFGKYKIGLIPNKFEHGEVIDNHELDGFIVPFPELAMPRSLMESSLIISVDVYASLNGDIYTEFLKQTIDEFSLNGTDTEYERLVDEMEYSEYFENKEIKMI